MEDHCDRGEYISIGADQWPPDWRDWDLGFVSAVTEGQHDEADTQEESRNINGEAHGDGNEIELVGGRG